MTYRELAEMIEVLLTEEQKDQKVVVNDLEYGLKPIINLKVSGNGQAYFSEIQIEDDELMPYKELVK